MNGPIVVSTAASEHFAFLIAKKLSGSEIVLTTRKPFGNGERYLKVDLDSRGDVAGRDVVFVASTPTDADFEEVCRVGSTIAEGGARSITYVIPFFGYGGMDKAVKPFEVVTAKTLARQLSQLPHGRFAENAFLLLDTHTPGLKHYFEGHCFREEYYAEGVLVEAIRELALTNFIFGTADLSRVKWAKAYARIFGTRIVIVDKSRDFESTHVDAVIGDVRGTIVVIYDDMIRSAGSVIDATEEYLKKGAVAVYVVTSHLSLNDEQVIDRLEFSKIQQVIATNSHPMSQHPKVLGSSKFLIKDISRLFIDPIIRLIG